MSIEGTIMNRSHRLARTLYADSSDREQLLEDYIKMVSFDGQREIAPKYIEHLRKQFTDTPLPELLQRIEEDRTYAASERKQWEMSNEVRARDEESRKL